MVRIKYHLQFSAAWCRSPSPICSIAFSIILIVLHSSPPSSSSFQVTLQPTVFFGTPTITTTPNLVSGNDHFLTIRKQLFFSLTLLSTHDLLENIYVGSSAILGISPIYFTPPFFFVPCYLVCARRYQLYTNKSYSSCQSVSSTYPGASGFVWKLPVKLRKKLTFELSVGCLLW